MDVESGHIWPANSGREWLRRVLLSEPERGPEIGDGMILFESALYRMTTSPADVHPTIELARATLVRLARAAISLGEFGPSKLVYVIQTGREGAARLWRAAPHLGTVLEILEHAHVTRNFASLNEILEKYIGALRGIHAALGRLELGYSVEFEHFSLQGDRVVYTGPVDCETAEVRGVMDVITKLHQLSESAELVERVEVLLAEMTGRTPERLELSS